MSPDVLAEKWESLRRCLARVEGRVPASPEALASDLDAQDIVSLNLQRAVQIAVDVAAIVAGELEVDAPRTMAESFSSLGRAGVLTEETAERMVRAVGFRNLAVHRYRELDWAIVFKVATEHTDDFRAFAREVERWRAAGEDADEARATEVS